MKIDTRDLVSITDYSRSPAKFVKELAEKPRRVILRNNQPAAVLMTLDEVQNLDEKRELLLRLSAALSEARERGKQGRELVEEVLGTLEREFGLGAPRSE